MVLVLCMTFFSHFAKQPLGSDLVLLELRISQFICLVEDL